MKRKDIELALKKDSLIDFYERVSPEEVIDFAMEQVRKHNEECAKIAQEYSGHWRTAQAIREVKP